MAEIGLEENFISEKDKSIQNSDIPERMYQRAFKRTIDDGELEEEKLWICSQPDMKKEIVVFFFFFFSKFFFSCKR